MLKLRQGDIDGDGKITKQEYLDYSLFLEKTEKMICHPDFRSLEDPNTRDEKLQACAIHKVKDACVTPCQWNNELNSDYEFNGLVQLAGKDPTQVSQLTKEEFM